MSEGACTVRAMTEIEWLDGGVTKVPELALGDAFGESVQAELDFGFDDVLEGLWVEVRHHEPDEDSDGDPRGSGCALYAGCRYSLVEPSDLDRVFCILYEGQPRVCRVAGELVNLSRACALSCLMLGSPCPPGALEALAACARYLCGPAFTSDLAARARAAGELGPRVGGERGRCVGIRDGGGFRNACGGENPVGRGLFVMLDIASQYGSTNHLRDGPTG